MIYKLEWVYRGNEIASLKNKTSLRCSWGLNESGWIVDDIHLKPEKTLAKRKEYLESIVKRSFYIASLAIKDGILNNISMIHDARGK